MSTARTAIAIAQTSKLIDAYLRRQSRISVARVLPSSSPSKSAPVMAVVRTTPFTVTLRLPEKTNTIDETFI